MEKEERAWRKANDNQPEARGGSLAASVKKCHACPEEDLSAEEQDNVRHNNNCSSIAIADDGKQNNNQPEASERARRSK